MRSILSVFFVFSLLTIGCSQQEKGLHGDHNHKNPTITDYLKGKDYSAYQVATFAGGCFWCTEGAFERINGVVDVISGYSGGKQPHPTYEEVGRGRTRHAEAIQIYYDPEVVDFATLLDVLFVAHDPTQVDRQGNDVGPQYRSAVFYHSAEQKALTEKAIQGLNDSDKWSKPVATEVSAYQEFWVAEEYHQNYYELHPNQPYVRGVSRPKVEKVKKTFKAILKPKYR
ncbi:MAG: peptide-methionine (S)-S-oxide reductase MsrA, partial [Bacteroidota bacterium]